MKRWKIRTLLDRVVDDRSLTLSDLRTLSDLHSVRPLNMGFLMKIGARYRSWSIRRSFPRYVRSFIQFCMDRLRDRDGIIYGSSPSISDVDYRLLVSPYSRAMGLNPREKRYHLQLDGLDGFSVFRPAEIAKQDGVTAAYDCKVRAQLRRKLQLALVGTEFQFQRTRRISVNW